MPEYPQFCAVARAAEVFGERWTLLILRELWLGPKRFSDLKERLDPIAPGVLNGRLRSLRAHGVIRKRDVLPPTPATLYELTEAGEAVGPALIELLRWGARYLFPPRPGERFEPDWFRMVLAAYAAPPPAPEAELGLAVSGDPAVRPAALVRAGPDGVVIFPYDGGAATEIAAPPAALLGLMSGRLSLTEGERSGGVHVRGDREVAALFPQLFRVG